jgi:hypothetical protein
MWRLSALAFAAAGLVAIVLAGLHMLEADRERAFARGRDAGLAEGAASVVETTNRQRVAAQTALAETERRVAELEEARDGLADQVQQLGRRSAASVLRHRPCLDARSVRLLGAIGRGGADPGAGP